MQYKFSIAAIVSGNIPAVIKLPKLYALVRMFNAPLSSLFESFVAYRISSIQEKNKTGQTIVLQRALSQYADANGGFGQPSPSEVEGVQVVQIPRNPLIHVEDFENTVVLPVLVLRREKLILSDFAQIGKISEGVQLQCAKISESEPLFDFQIRIQKSLVIDVSQRTLRSVIDTYKSAGRTYTIIIYN